MADHSPQKVIKRRADDGAPSAPMTDAERRKYVAEAERIARDVLGNKAASAEAKDLARRFLRSLGIEPDDAESDSKAIAKKMPLSPSNGFAEYAEIQTKALAGRR